MTENQSDILAALRQRTLERHRERREKIATRLLAAMMCNPMNDDSYARTLVADSVKIADMLIDEVEYQPIPKRKE